MPPEAELFGQMPDGAPVHRVTLQSDVLCVRVITYGAVLQSIEAPDRAGVRVNVALGLATMADYIAHSRHFGAVAGRYAGRIGHGRFTLDGVTYQLSTNAGPHAIHGGVQDFGKHNWTLGSHDARHVELTLDSPDGDEGYPGALHVRVCYSVEGSDLRIDYHAETSAPTVINLTNHSYFNLGGEGSGDVLGHRLTIDSGEYLPADADCLPTGEILPVVGTPFDFRTPHAIGARIREAHPQLLFTSGYDHAFPLPGQGMRRAALLEDPVSGRTLTVLTTEPCVHLYSANNLNGSVAGPSGRTYRQSDGVCLETEHPQDSPNRAHFPSTVLRPGVDFGSSTIFRFGVSPL